jgi:chromosome segregation ATPase
VEQKPEEQAQVEEQPVETKPEVVVEEIVEVKFTQAEVDAKLAEKEIEITNLKKELDSKNQEIAELKAPKVEVAKVEEKPELIVGDATAKTIDKYIERRKKINKKAYGHDNNGN